MWTLLLIACAGAFFAGLLLPWADPPGRGPHLSAFESFVAKDDILAGAAIGLAFGGALLRHTKRRERVVGAFLSLLASIFLIGAMITTVLDFPGRTDLLVDAADDAELLLAGPIVSGGSALLACAVAARVASTVARELVTAARGVTIGLAAAVMFGGLYLDLASDVWVKLPLIAAVFSSGLLLVLTMLGIEQAVELDRQKRWAPVVREATHVFADDAKALVDIVEDVLEGPRRQPVKAMSDPELRSIALTLFEEGSDEHVLGDLLPALQALIDRFKADQRAWGPLVLQSEIDDSVAQHHATLTRALDRLISAIEPLDGLTAEERPGSTAAGTAATASIEALALARQIAAAKLV